MEAFHVEKSPKKGTKVFAEGIFLCVLRRILFWQGQRCQRRNVKEYACKVPRLCHFRTVNFFPNEGHSMMMDRHFSSRSLSWIYGMPTRFDGDSAARSEKGGHLSLSPRRGPVHDRNFVVRIGRKTVFLAYIKSSCDVISRDLFLCDSSRFSVERINDKIQFLSKKNQTSTPFLPICEK